MSSVTDLRKDYGDFQVNISQMEIPDFGVTVLKGPSGSGKSSVFRLLCGLDVADSLTWKFADLDLAKLSPAERRIGVVFQSWDLFPHMTARENLEFAAKVRGIKAVDTATKITRLSEALNMSKFLDRNSMLLSGGEQQRTAIARAMMGNPRILFLDEPFSALDQENRSEARELVRQVLHESKIPALLVTHDNEDVQHLADKVFHIENGSLIRSA